MISCVIQGLHLFLTQIFLSGACLFITERTSEDQSCIINGTAAHYSVVQIHIYKIITVREDINVFEITNCHFSVSIALIFGTKFKHCIIMITHGTFSNTSQAEKYKLNQWHCYTFHSHSRAIRLSIFDKGSSLDTSCLL